GTASQASKSNQRAGSQGTPARQPSEAAQRGTPARHPSGAVQRGTPAGAGPTRQPTAPGDEPAGATDRRRAAALGGDVTAAGARSRDRPAQRSPGEALGTR